MSHNLRYASASQRAIHAAADSHREVWRRVFLAAFQLAANRVEDTVPDDATAFQLEQLFAKSFMAMEDLLIERLPTVLLDTLSSGAKAATGPNGTVRTAKARGTFDKTNKLAQDHATKQAAKLVKDVTGETRKAIRDVIAKGFENQIPVKTIAKQLTQVIGMNSVQAKAHVKQFPNPNTPEAKKAAAATIKRRALNIARTETMSASNEGQRQLWLQEISKGNLPPTAQRVWIITNDEKLCPICTNLNGDIVGITETFDGGLLNPPAHPQCRCTQALWLKTDPLIQDHFSEVASPSGDAPNVNAAYSAIDDEMKRLKAEYPGLSNLKLNKLEVVDAPTLAHAAKPGQVGLFSPSHDTIMVAAQGKAFTHPDLQVGPEVFSTSGKTVLGIYKHELGHKLYYKTVVKNKANQGVWKQITSDPNLAGKISQYAKTSPGELFSEAFAAYTHPAYKPGMLPAEVEGFMAKVFGKKVGGSPSPFAAPVFKTPTPPGIAHVPPVAPHAAPVPSGVAPLAPHAAPTPKPLGKLTPVHADVPPPKWFDELLSNKVGSAAGSNPGGVYVHPTTNEKYYVKFYKDPAQGVQEHLTNKIYKRLGLEAPETTVGVNTAGRQVFASKWNTNLSGTGQTLGVTKMVADKFLDGFMGDVLVKNWDAVGLSKDNIGVLSNGKIIRLDQGGSLLYRAQGALKPAASLNNIDEWEGLFDVNKNPAYSAVAKIAGVAKPEDLGHYRLQQQLNDAKKIVGKWDDVKQWQDFVDDAAPLLSPEQRKQVAEMLHARIVKLDAKVASVTAPTAKPVAAPPPVAPAAPVGKFVPPDGDPVVPSKPLAPSHPSNLPSGLQNKLITDADVFTIKQTIKGGGSAADVKQKLGLSWADADTLYAHFKWGPGAAGNAPPIGIPPVAPKPVAPPTPVKQAPVTPSVVAPQPGGAKNWTENDIAWMKKLYGEGKTVAQIAKQFGSGNTTVVHNIVKNKTWKQVSPSMATGTMPVYGTTIAKPSSGPAPVKTPPKSEADVYKAYHKIPPEYSELTADQTYKAVNALKDYPQLMPQTLANILNVTKAEAEVIKNYIIKKHGFGGATPSTPSSLPQAPVGQLVMPSTIMGLTASVWTKALESLKINPSMPSGTLALSLGIPQPIALDLKKYLKQKYQLGLYAPTPTYSPTQSYPDPPSTPGTEIQAVKQKYESTINSLSQNQKKYLVKYTADSSDINSYLRNEHSYASPQTMKEQQAAINSAMRAAPRPPPPTKVYRRIYAEDSFMKTLTPGTELAMKGYQSSSVDHFVFSGNMEFEIVNPKAGIYIQPISKHPNEREFLLPHNARYRVLKTLPPTQGYKLRVQLEMLDAGDI